MSRTYNTNLRNTHVEAPTIGVGEGVAASVTPEVAPFNCTRSPRGLGCERGAYVAVGTISAGAGICTGFCGCRNSCCANGAI